MNNKKSVPNRKTVSFGNIEIPTDVKYTAYVVGDGRSRVFCPIEMTYQEAELKFLNFVMVDPTVLVNPVCLVVA